MGRIVNNRLDKINASICRTTPSQTFRDTIRLSENENFEFASNYKTIKYQDRTTALWNDIGVRLVSPYKIELSGSIHDDFYQLLFKPSDEYVVKLGNLFEFDGYRYLTTDTDGDNSCFVQRCNVQLKFVDNNNPVIGSTPTFYTLDAVAITNLSMPPEGRQQMKMGTLSDDEMKILVPNSETARLIKYSSGGGTRFLLGNPLRSYSCVAIDSVSFIRKDLNGDESGYLVLKLSNKIGTNSIQDNLTLGLAKQNCYSGGV